MGLADGGYTYFGRVFDRLLDSRGYNQSTFAAECRRRKFRVGRPGKQRDVNQRSVSDWMRGITACPREVPTYADAILVLSEEEWAGFALAYAYGQTVPEEEFEDLLKFREFYRAELAEGASTKARIGRRRGAEARCGLHPLAQQPLHHPAIEALQGRELTYLRARFLALGTLPP